VRKEFFIHLAFLVALVVFVSLVKGWLNLSYWPFWVGALVGTALPDLDHLIYIFFLRPQELTSQRATAMVQKKDFVGTARLLGETRYERTKVIFHTANFQAIFTILAFWVISSSGNVFGRGLVLAFMLHMIIDELVDIRDTGNLNNWIKDFPLVLEGNEKVYLGANIAILLLFSFVF
jgi:hypothetical protein